MPMLLSTAGVVPNRLHGSSNCCLRPALYILTHKAATLNTRRTARKLLAEERIRSAWLVRPYCFENQPNCCEVRKVDDTTIIIIIIIIIIITSTKIQQIKYNYV
jgi:hypothetical protein